MGMPDDDTLRIVQCIGNHILAYDEVSKESAVFIPLQMPQKYDSINVEIWGSANCTHITGDVYTGGNVSHIMNN